MLQVAMGGEVISSSVVFEYKARDLPALPSSQHDWLSLDGEDTCLFKFHNLVLFHTIKTFNLNHFESWRAWSLACVSIVRKQQVCDLLFKNAA